VHGEPLDALQKFEESLPYGSTHARLQRLLITFQGLGLGSESGMVNYVLREVAADLVTVLLLTTKSCVSNITKAGRSSFHHSSARRDIGTVESSAAGAHIGGDSENTLQIYIAETAAKIVG